MSLLMPLDVSDDVLPDWSMSLVMWMNVADDAVFQWVVSREMLVGATGEDIRV